MTTSPSATPDRPAPSARFSDEAAPSLLQAIGSRGLARIAVLGTLLVIVFWGPLSLTVIHRWKNDADWSHGWLVPLFSLYFLHAHSAQLASAVRRINYAGLLVVLGALGVYFWTLWITPVSYLRPLCFVATIFGLTLFLGGWQVLRITWLPIAFLILAIPLPGGLYVDLTMPLQKIASVVSAALLSVIPDLQIDVSGVVIDYNYLGVRDHLNVEQACSGMRLTMTFVTLGVAVAYLGGRPFWQRLVMVAACVPIAVFCNVIRVTVTCLLHVFKDRPIGQTLHFESLSRGTPHLMLGIAMLFVATGLFALVGWVLSNLFIEETDETADRSV